MAINFDKYVDECKNRFDAAGIRNKRRELIRKGAADVLWCVGNPPDNSTIGDVYRTGEYRVTLEEDPDEDGAAICMLVLDPVKE